MENIPLNDDMPMSSRKSPVIIISSVIIAALVAGGGVYAYQKNQNDKQTADLQAQIDTLNSQLAVTTPTPTPIVTATPTALATATATPNVTANWKTYTNTKYAYSIKYPSDWTVTPFTDLATGANFSPTTSPAGSAPAISVAFATKPSDYSQTSFAEYVKIAAIQEIEGYNKLESSKAITTTSGVMGYQNTWDVTGHDGKTSISNPITYFQPKDTTGTVQVTFGSADNLETYNNMVSTYQQ